MLSGDELFGTELAARPAKQGKELSAWWLAWWLPDVCSMTRAPLETGARERPVVYISISVDAIAHRTYLQGCWPRSNARIKLAAGVQAHSEQAMWRGCSDCVLVQRRQHSLANCSSTVYTNSDKGDVAEWRAALLIWRDIICDDTQELVTSQPVTTNRRVRT